MRVREAGGARIAVLLALGLGAAARAADCPAGLTIGFNDTPFPPMLEGRGPEFPAAPGWIVEATRLALRELDCPAQLLRKPSRRLESELESGRLGMALLVGATPERLVRLRFPLDAQGRPDLSLAPVLTRMALYATADRATSLGWDPRRQTKGLRIGVVAGTTQEQTARRLGWQLEPIATFEAGTAMLRAHRFDALLANPESLPPQELQGPQALVELQPEVQQVAYFPAASQALTEQAPNFMPRFWRALCAAIRRGAHPSVPPGCGR